MLWVRGLPIRGRSKTNWPFATLCGLWWCLVVSHFLLIPINSRNEQDENHRADWSRPYYPLGIVRHSANSWLFLAIHGSKSLAILNWQSKNIFPPVILTCIWTWVLSAILLLKILSPELQISFQHEKPLHSHLPASCCSSDLELTQME